VLPRRILSAVTAVAAAALAAADAPRPRLWMPQVASEHGVVTIAAERFTARLAVLDDATRPGWIERHTGHATDPFAASPDRRGGFLTFLLDLEARGPGRLQFQPLAARIAAPDGDMRSPLDVPTIHSMFGLIDREVPAAYVTTLDAVLLQKPVELAEGARATGLLAFRAQDLAARRLRLEVRLTGPGGEELGFEVPFVAVKAPPPGSPR
jgi:hypothetical protein